MLFVITQILVLSQNTRLSHGPVLWHKPVPTDSFIITTGHGRRPYNQDRSLPTTLYTVYTIMQSPQNTLWIPGRVLLHLLVTTDDFIIKTGHYRRLYIRLPSWVKSLRIHWKYMVVYYDIYRSWPTALYSRPVTADDFIHVLPSWVKSLRIHWKYTVVYYDIYRSRPTAYIQDRSLPTTLYTFYPVGQSPSEYTENTRSCIMTSTGHDRLLYKRPPQVLGLRSTGLSIWYFDSGRALPTIRIIVLSSPMVSVWPNTTAQTISEWYMVVWHSLIERVAIFLYLTVQEHNWVPHVIHFKSTQIRPDFYIYTHERSFCLIVSIIINIRYISR